MDAGQRICAVAAFALVAFGACSSSTSDLTPQLFAVTCPDERLEVGKTAEFALALGPSAEACVNLQWSSSDSMVLELVNTEPDQRFTQGCRFEITVRGKATGKATAGAKVTAEPWASEPTSVTGTNACDFTVVAATADGGADLAIDAAPTDAGAADQRIDTREDGGDGGSDGGHDGGDGGSDASVDTGFDDGGDAGDDAGGDAGADAGSSNVRVVALSGGPAPVGTSGVTFDSFEHVGINASGEVAFFATLQGTGVDLTNHRALFSDRGGSLHLVARSGETAPGTAASWTNFAQPIINAQGEILFWATVEGPENGLWTSKLPAPGTIEKVAVEGESAGSLVTGATWSVIGERHPWGDGDTGLFWARLSGAGITAANDDGLFAIDGTGSAPVVTLVAREGDSAPVTNADYTTIHASNVQLRNGTDASAFTALITGATARLFSIDTAGDIAVVAAQGTYAPGASGPSLPDLARFGQSFEIGGINASGHLAFAAALRSESNQPIQANKGIWTDASGDLRLVVRRGQDIPDCGVPCSETFDNFGKIAINDAGTLVFRAALAGSSIDGIWATPGTAHPLTEIVREGDAVPGISACAATFVGDFSATSARVVLAGDDDIVFFARIEGPCIDLTNDSGIWRYDGVSGQLEALLRESDVLDLGADGQRTVRSLGFLHWFDGSDQQRVVANGDGRRSAYNDSGQLAIQAVFTDSSEAVLVLTP